MKYAHLNVTERELIAKKLHTRQSIRAIAKALERSTSSISREIRRNSLPEIYTQKNAVNPTEPRWTDEEKFPLEWTFQSAQNPWKLAMKLAIGRATRSSEPII